MLDGWLNTDIDVASSDIVYLDVRKRFPFRDCIFDYVFCEHLIEHLEYKEGLHMLRESFRVLKPGGKIRIATPDLCFLIELYNSKKTQLQQKYITWTVDTFLRDIGIYEDTFVINNFFRRWGHKFIYDFKTLSRALCEVGFINIKRCEVGESDDEHLRGIESHGKHISDEFNMLETFVVEAVKPSDQERCQ